MKAVIRRATVADANALSSLNAAVHALHAAALPWFFRPSHSAAFPATAAAAVLTNPHDLIFVADLDADQVGYAHGKIIRQPGTAWQLPQELVFVDAIVVLPPYQRQGIGRALLDTLRSAANDVGIDVLSLNVWTFNEGARAFFRRCGFTAYNEQLWNR